MKWRLRAAWSVLRGRPTIFGLRKTSVIYHPGVGRYSVYAYSCSYMDFLGPEDAEMTLRFDGDKQVWTFPPPQELLHVDKGTVRVVPAKARTGPGAVDVSTEDEPA